MGYTATTSAEKAKALRREARGEVRITRERESRIIRMKNGKRRLQGREYFIVEEIQKGEA